MNISNKDIEYVASLSKFELSDDEKKIFTSQLREVLLYIEKLNKLNTENIAPLIHPFNITNIFREDTLEESIRREKALSLAPATEGFFFKYQKYWNK